MGEVFRFLPALSVRVRAAPFGYSLAKKHAPRMISIFIYISVVIGNMVLTSVLIFAFKSGLGLALTQPR